MIDFTINITEKNIRLASILIFIIIMAIIYSLSTNRGRQIIDLTKVIVEASPRCPDNNSSSIASSSDKLGGLVSSLDGLKKAVEDGKCVRITAVLG